MNDRMVDYTTAATAYLREQIDRDILDMLRNRRSVVIYGNIRPHRKRTWITVDHSLPVPVKDEKDLRSYARHIELMPLVGAINRGEMELAKELALPFFEKRFCKVDCLRVRRVTIE